ncbi:beta-ketoacyl synthase N-terminal-like domain-containing protein [Jatrophihabitans sp. DSM 44399]|uniref:Beta-ketoacyl synthase N-terminal-like domain-containing protein n=1 Tax=Jatrophihabitans lederbergiae TaxID=3075547 RepID=A0ABU2JH85_9ACTN|nr:beta-ketoacyl synthase N-terminal-like domain-containing protein [Jatrophihabitans sp. DSM 44399]MDT0264361.1 beta-ketoacyl synthase N-terminal-like domain-containing protein [Jatrophihabitans sp. DSM 44399]
MIAARVLTEGTVVRRRVVITGIGVIAPGGIGVKSFWSLLTEGRTATRRVTHFDPSPFRSQLAAEADFDPIQEGLDIQRAVGWIARRNSLW